MADIPLDHLIAQVRGISARQLSSPVPVEKGGQMPQWTGTNSGRKSNKLMCARCMWGLNEIQIRSECKCHVSTTQLQKRWREMKNKSHWQCLRLFFFSLISWIFVIHWIWWKKEECTLKSVNVYVCVSVFVRGLSLFVVRWVFLDAVSHKESFRAGRDEGMTWSHNLKAQETERPKQLSSVVSVLVKADEDVIHVKFLLRKL